MSSVWLILCFLCALCHAQLFLPNASCTAKASVECLDATCGVAPPPDVSCAAYGRSCTDRDIGEAWTECDSKQKRDLFYFWKPPATCRGGIDLPPAVSGIPCDLVCTEGTFLHVTDKQCEPCAAGSYSLGGGRRWTEWFYWPAQMTTTCTNSTGSCPGWKLQGSSISSGDSTDQTEYVSELTLLVQLVRPGYIQFTYRVQSSDPSDGLQFFIGSKISMDRQSVVGQWTQYKAPLSVGFHKLTWTYSKSLLHDVEADEAMLSSIEVVGNSFASLRCELCPPGSYNNQSGSSSCLPCPRDTYTNTSGQTSCVPCAAGYYATMGSEACSKRPACTVLDQIVNISQCVNGHSIATFQWDPSSLCDVNTSTVPLMDPREQECAVAVCLPGTSRIINSTVNLDQCHTCPSGFWSPGDVSQNNSECRLCPAGSEAPKSAIFKNFAELPNGFETFCEGHCATEGWRASGGMLNTGTGHGEDVELSLRHMLNMTGIGSMQFNGKLVCEGSRSARLELSVNYIQIDSWSCQSDSGVVSARLSLSASTKVIEWTFIKSGMDEETDAPNAYAKINLIQINGTDSGGGIACEPCHAGSYSLGGVSKCSLCPAGTFSEPNATSCTPCPAGTFANAPGAKQCRPCGQGTASDVGSSSCNSTCVFTAGNSTFDLQPLDKPDMWFINGDDSYYISVCKPNAKDCYRTGDEPLNTYSCRYESEFAVWDLGSTVSYEVNETGVVAKFSEGSSCVNRQNETKQISSSVQLICDPHATIAMPTFSRATADPAMDDPCFYSFEWKTAHACRLCTSSDMHSVVSVCRDGQRQQSYLWNEPKECFGGAVRPAPVSMECDVHYEASFNQVVLVGVIVGACVLTLPFLIFATVQYRRYRGLYSRYEQVQQSNLDEEDNRLAQRMRLQEEERQRQQREEESDEDFYGP
eukprot:GILK01010513.1.p1 GENE.GILK01010513.1~~GILK01010513.1.p1  ORF type:complete len:921 (+),score=74.55 GILK01010513.1:200-2962(+)